MNNSSAKHSVARFTGDPQYQHNLNKERCLVPSLWHKGDGHYQLSHHNSKQKVGSQQLKGSKKSKLIEGHSQHRVDSLTPSLA